MLHQLETFKRLLYCHSPFYPIRSKKANRTWILSVYPSTSADSMLFFRPNLLVPSFSRTVDGCGISFFVYRGRVISASNLFLLASAHQPGLSID
jgi:hypothetical protein